MRTTVAWNEDWRFCKCPDILPDPAQPIEGEAITLPHTWYADEDYYRGDGIYQKRFYLQAAGEKVFLRFHGVDKCCRIYLNGQEIAHHEGGYTIFAVELTDALAADGENLLSVLVNNEAGETVSPLSGDFACFGGIHRKVELIRTGSIHFPVCHYGTAGVLLRTLADGANGILLAEVPHGDALPADVQVRYTLYDPDGEVALCQTAAPVGTARLTLHEPRWWNGRQDPALYRVQAALIRGNETLDMVSQTVGFRSYAVDPDKGFFLNGKHLKLRGVAKHQDTEGVFSAAGEENWRTDLDLIAEMGANAVRLSHYPHPQRVYELCDGMGLVVWAEIPLLKMTRNEQLLENAAAQLTELILQNLHHPSICFWGLQNEIAIFGDKPYMAQGIQKLNELAHRLDPYRLTASANLNAVECGSALNRVTDVTAYNIYYGWYYGQMADHAAFLDEFHRVNPNMPLAISEYGADCNPVFHSDTPRVNDYTEEFQALYHETVYPYMAQRDFVWGSFVWNMFDFVSAIRNVGGVKARNIKGLVTFDRKTRKDAYYYYKAIWSEQPFVQIAQKRYVNRVARSITVKVYSNLSQVKLTVHGCSYVALVENGSARFQNIPLNPGENLVRAEAEGYADSAVFCCVEQADPAYVFVDQNPGLNVRNWFEDEAEEARLFPEDAYSLRDKLSKLMANAQVIALVDDMNPVISKLMRQAPDTFTLEQVIRHEKPDVPEEDIKALNLALTTIPKV